MMFNDDPQTTLLRLITLIMVAAIMCLLAGHKGGKRTIDLLIIGFVLGIGDLIVLFSLIRSL